jgi:hypothetical protein
MVRCLLYSAGLSAKFWSAALIHSVYLKNRLFHKEIVKRPYEGWTGIKPELDHLRTFGALVTARNPGKRPAKTDRHTAHGVLLGFGSSTKHVRYFDLTARHPAGAQVLMDMGYNIPSLPLVPLQLSQFAMYPKRSHRK